MENNKPENPQAFPLDYDDNYGGGELHRGMTLRDYFAAKAMGGFFAANPKITGEEIAEISYEMADLMLKQRLK